MAQAQQLSLSRRAFTRLLGVAVFVPGAAACGSSASADADLDAGTDSGAGSGSGSGGGTDTGSDVGADASDGTGTGATAWATGGTAAMVAAADYPNPFAAPGASTCSITCTTTIGPCHTTSPERQDVSNGADGLPVRLAIRILDEDCAPVEGVIVEIWHANTEGVYSGDINAMCNDSEDDRTQDFYRGYQRTDADGVVHFDTCYPGWYGGRAVHIHVRVLSGDYNAADNAPSEVITQLFFADALNAEIFGAEPVYSAYGEPDTSLTTDNIAGGSSDIDAYVCDVQRMVDGAMLASKTLILRTTSAACSL